MLKEDQMSSMRSYRTMEDFQREEIRPSFRIGFSLDDLEDSSFEAEMAFDLDRDELELSPCESDDEVDDEDEDEDEAEE
jgi:hypothetical protein